MRALLVVAALTGVAAADDTFETKAQGARPVKHLDELVWTLTATCDRGDVVEQRQCKLLRDTQAKAIEGQTLLVEADAAAFVVAPWSKEKKSVALTLSGCIACGGVNVDGKAWHLTGGAARVEGDKVAAPVLYDNAIPFSDEATANAWIKRLASPRVQMVVKLGPKARWHTGGKDGLALDVVAWRVVAPCSGEVAIASPSSGNAAPDPKACPKPAPKR